MKLPKGIRPNPIIVGSVSEKDREEVGNTVQKHFNKDTKPSKGLRSKINFLAFIFFDLIKKPYERLAIFHANQITNSILKRLELPTFDIPSKNIVILPNLLYKKTGPPADSDGSASCVYQQVIINRTATKNPIYKIHVIFHEIIHLKSLYSIEVKRDFYRRRQFGFSLYPSDKKVGWFGNFFMFRGLNEAIVEEIERTFSPIIINKNKYIKKWVVWNGSKKTQAIKQELREKNGIEPGEIIWVTKRKKIITFGYRRARKVLNFIVDCIYEDNPDRFTSRQEVMELFFSAIFTGHLLPTARLIEKSFGKGSFRTIGMMDRDDYSANRTLAELSKKR